MDESLVGVFRTNHCYYPTKQHMFRPSEEYPELKKLNMPISPVENHVYEAVREAVYLAGFDAENYGTNDWNPFGQHIGENDTVVIKPNLVMDQNHNKRGGNECLYTHPSVVAPIIDYVILALQYSGRIIIGDAPMQECNFEKLVTESGYKDLVRYYQECGYNVELVDFRQLSSVVVKGVHHFSIDKEKKGKVIDLGKESAHFVEKDTKRKLRITNYDHRILAEHHHNNVHEYCVSPYVLEADVIINMPKPKSHRKAGMTIALKNMVGISTRKEYLPHHTMGAIAQGGDEYKDSNLIHMLRSKLLDKKNIYTYENKFIRARMVATVSKVLSRILQMTNSDKFREGSWYGNDTISRTIVDLNRIVQYADKEGRLQGERTRKMIIVADMIISGEKEGPVAPSPKELGLIVVGEDAVCFDEAVATIVGFDYERIPTIIRARQENGRFRLSDKTVKVMSNDPRLNCRALGEIPIIDELKLVPTSGWESHIERTEAIHQ